MRIAFSVLTLVSCAGEQVNLKARKLHIEWSKDGHRYAQSEAKVSNKNIIEDLVRVSTMYFKRGDTRPNKVGLDLVYNIEQSPVYLVRSYTDDTGSRKRNVIVAKGRARSVADLLRIRFPTSLVIELPIPLKYYVNQNRTESERALNRRVELFIRRKI